MPSLLQVLLHIGFKTLGDNKSFNIENHLAPGSAMITTVHSCYLEYYMTQNLANFLVCQAHGMLERLSIYIKNVLAKY